ncbi:hypothetical protein Peur_037748 [Populus x canadensis]
MVLTFEFLAIVISQKSQQTPSNHSLKYVISILLFGANRSCCLGSWNNSSKDLKGQQLNDTFYHFSIEFM